MTTSAPRWPRRDDIHVSPRALALAASVTWRHVTADPVRALVLAWRVMPDPTRRWLRFAGPYGRATTLWGAGDRQAALAALDASPRRLAAFSLAVNQPEVAAAAVGRLAAGDRARPVLAARLAWREGRLTEAIQALDRAPGRARDLRARRLRRTLAAEQAVLGGARLQDGLVRGGQGDLARGAPRVLARGAPRVLARGAPRVLARGIRGDGSLRTRGGQGGPALRGNTILHLVTDALPATSAGYTIRTHETVLAQRAAGLDPHVVTRCGYPVTQGRIDGRHLVMLDGIPYHRLLPWRLPGHADTDPRIVALGVELAARLTEQIRPAVLHAASNYANARIALALGERYGLPVVYEVRGFWEDTWLSRHRGGDELAGRELYGRNRHLETRCMLAADLVVTLGAAMRDEIVSRGVPAEKVLIVPNAVSGEFLGPLPDAAALRTALGIGPEEFVVGVASTLVPHEGIGTLLEACELLRARGLPVRVVIVGDGPERAALQRQAAGLGLREAAIFTGRVPAGKVREFHALLDIFVVPRTPDRVCQLVTPLKPVEAMASGLCVVTSEVNALTEIIKHEVTGALTIPQDPVSLADCLEFLLYSPDIRRKLGENAREWVTRDRTWAHNAARYRDAYARLGAT